MNFGALPEPGTSLVRTGLATPILGSLRSPRPRVPRKAGLHASEPSAERVRPATARLVVVKLQ